MSEASKAARLWGSILVIVFTAGALVSCSTSDTATAPSTPTPATGTAQPPPTSAATTQAGASVPIDADRAAAIPLGDADLPDGWVVADKDSLSGLLEGCTSGLLADGGAGASGQQFADEDASGSFASMGYVLTSIAGASQVFDDLNGAELQECILDALPEVVETPGSRVSAMSVSRLDLPLLGERTGGARYVVALVSDSDPEAPGLVYDVFWVLNGRELAGMAVGGSEASPTATVKERLLRALGAKIGAADNEPAPEPAESTEQTQPSETAPPAVATAELEELVRAWYEESDPRVCERMTDAMLDFGWGSTADKGRQECQRSLEAADPANDVTVKSAKASEGQVTVDVAYAVSDGRNIDRVTFVREGGEWLIDRVRLTSFE